jgi:hypothetical protein
MTLKIKALLVLFGLCADALGQAVNLTCTREIVESYGIISYDQAKKERLVMCPHIQYTCCPAYEQFKMFKIYSDTVRPSLILLNEVIKKELELLEKEVGNLVASGKIEGKIQGIADKAVQLRVQFTWNKIKDKRPKAIFEKLNKYQKVSSNYVAAWKSAFFCTICDFANQNFIDIQNKRITYSAASCDAFVQNTITYAYLLNVVLIPYLSALTEIISRLDGNAKYQKLHNFQRVLKAIRDCVADYKQYDSGLANCKAYCEFFNLVQDVYIYEGYPEFFANTLVMIRMFLSGGSATPVPAVGAGAGAGTPAQSRRLIEQSVKDLIRQTRNRRLNQKIDDNYYFEAKVPKGSKFRQFNRRRVLEETDEFTTLERIQNQHFRLENRRILPEASQDWSQDLLDPNNNVTQIVDIFGEQAYDPEFGDAELNQMMQVVDIFNAGDSQHAKMLFEKYFVENYSADLNDIDLPDLFKQRSLNSTNYSSYKTGVSFSGIDLHRCVEKMKWNLVEKEIQMSMTASSKVESEMIEESVILACNNITNRDVEDFYGDQFFHFRRPHDGLYNETIAKAIRDFALAKLRQIISEKMAVYNYLVKSVNQENADKAWATIDDMQKRMRGLALNDGNFSVSLHNETVNGVTFQSLNITGPANASGWANVTTIRDVQRLQSQYETREVLVNENQKNAFDLANPNGLAQAAGQVVAQGTPGTTIPQTPAVGTTTRKKRALMGTKKKHKLRK